jgi:hypothetical protein
MRDKTESALEQELIDAALNWQSARLYRIAMKGSPHAMEAEARFMTAERDLIAVASRLVQCRAEPLGTPEAKAIKEHADELAAHAAYAQVVREGQQTWDFDDYEECFKHGFLKGRGH